MVGGRHYSEYTYKVPISNPSYCLRLAVDVKSLQEHNGRVSNPERTSALPKRGFVLVEIGSDEHKRILRRPVLEGSQREIVDWKFVPACIDQGRMIEPNQLPAGSAIFTRGDDDSSSLRVLIWEKGEAATLLKYAYQLDVSPNTSHFRLQILVTPHSGL